MKKTTLAIMAAGMGSRFGKGIKQLAPVGPNGEIIMEYSIHDALEAGFNKIVFIIRKDLEEDFRRVIGNRMEHVAEIEYAFQELDDLPEGFSKPEERTKPWGTGQAVLCCKDIIHEPFAVINADDFYGKDAFVKLHQYLIKDHPAQNGVENVCMAGFVLENTLSENGGVTRGICQLDEESNLVGVRETFQVMRTEYGVECTAGDGSKEILDPKNLVSMNMWGFQPHFFKTLEEGFVSFLESVTEGDLRKEYLLPMKIDQLIHQGKVKVSVLSTDSQWFGVTYQEDKEKVVKAIQKLIDAGEYGSKLFE